LLENRVKTPSGGALKPNQKTSLREKAKRAYAMKPNRMAHHVIVTKRVRGTLFRYMNPIAVHDIAVYSSRLLSTEYASEMPWTREQRRNELFKENET
jgi:hypothetical protein